MSIEIITPGMYTTIQDKGRLGYQQFGMPVSGAMDLTSLSFGNLLVGNEPGTACLEATILPPEIHFLDAQFFSVTGAECDLFLSDQPVEQNRALFARPGDVLKMSAVKKGCRVYLALSGGIHVPSVMGSKSTYVNGGIGGTNGRALKAGDRLKTQSASSLPNFAFRKIPDSCLHQLELDMPVRVLLGPQENCFSEKGIKTFGRESYTVSNESDRMGYRLNGPVIEHAQGQDGNIISDAIAFGSIQVPGHGNPIILMADRQTTGGYTKIGTVISADLPKIAQRKAGDTVTFRLCDMEEALEANRAQHTLFADLRQLFDGQTILQSAQMNLQIEEKTYTVQFTEIMP